MESPVCAESPAGVEELTGAGEIAGAGRELDGNAKTVLCGSVYYLCVIKIYVGGVLHVFFNRWVCYLALLGYPLVLMPRLRRCSP